MSDNRMMTLNPSKLYVETKRNEVLHIIRLCNVYSIDFVKLVQQKHIHGCVCLLSFQVIKRYFALLAKPVATSVGIISFFYSNLSRSPAYLLDSAPPAAPAVGIIFGCPLSQDPGPCGADLVCLLDFCLLLVLPPCSLLPSLFLVGFAWHRLLVVSSE